MVMCSAGPANCNITCKKGCGCVYVWDDRECFCECYDDDEGGGTQSLSVGSLIDVSFNGLDLGRVAARFDKLLAQEVLVPAARAKRKVRLRLERVTFARALKTLGLQTRRRVKAKRRRTR